MGVLLRVCHRGMACWVFVVLGIMGCGDNGAKVAVTPPDAFPFVQCKVVMAGQDVAGAIVTLHADGARDQKIVSAYDSENDCYRFVTNVDGKKMAGVPEGEYKVAVKSGKGSKTRIPEKYADPKSSGLTAKVVKGENFLPPFELTR